NIVGRDYMACPRHILNNNIGISRYVLCQKLADGTDINIEQVSRRRSRDERDGLALIKGCLRLNGGTPHKQKKDYQGHSFHFDLRYETVSSWQKWRRLLFVISSPARNLRSLTFVRDDYATFGYCDTVSSPRIWTYFFHSPPILVCQDLSDPFDDLRRLHHNFFGQCF